MLAAIQAAQRRPFPTRGPLVSIIVLSRDGAHHLRRLLPALDATAYRSFEVLVVDNGSTDDTRAVLESEWSFPLRWIRNEHNASFSDGNTQAIATSRGELVLLLNNDIEPANGQWLGAMVAQFAQDPEPSAVGALLLNPPLGNPELDLAVQDSGVEFHLDKGVPDVRYGGGDSTDPALYTTRFVPAVTGAACLVKRATFEALGGFSPGYFYGYEDTDLCLRLQALGPLVIAGGAVLYHYVSQTLGEWSDARRRANWMAARRRFVEAWAPRLTRTLRRDLLGGRGWWGGGSAGTAAIILTADRESEGRDDYYIAHGLGAALAAAGWKVLYAEKAGDRWYRLPDNVGLVISLVDGYNVRRAPRAALTVAWVHSRVEQWLARRWFEDFDLLVAASSKCADLIQEATGLRTPVLPLAVDPEVFGPGPPGTLFAADYAFAGSYRGRERRAVAWLDVGSQESFIVVGQNWGRVGSVQRYWRGHLPQGLVAELYRSVKVALDDSVAPPEQGLVSSRVFEALAAGALVISDNVEGSRELFDGLLPTYRTPGELRDQLDRFLSDDEGRRRLVDALRRVVLEEHTFARRAEQFCQLALATVERPRVAVKAPLQDLPVGGWGDEQVAGSLARALRGCGFWAGVDPPNKWDELSRQGADVALHLRGRATYSPRPAQVNVLWLVGDGLEATVRECTEYDLVLCASQSKVGSLRAEGVRALFLPLAADSRRFGGAQPRDELRTGVLFVGNYRGQVPPVVHWCLERGLPLTVLGSGWEDQLPAGVRAAPELPRRDLGALYASAGAVLIETAPDAALWGMVPGRVFDVLAAGGVVLSEPNPGIDSTLPGLVPTFASAGDLGRVVGELAADGGSRTALIERGRRLVLAEHTMEARAAAICRLVWPLLQGRPSDCEGSVFGGGPPTGCPGTGLLQ